MSITKQEAAQALGEIDAARGRVYETKGYANAAPYLIIWGLVWMGADVSNQFAPHFPWAWPIGIAAGMVASLVTGFTYSKARTDGMASEGWRYFASWGFVLAFIVTLFLVIPVVSGRETHSVFGLLFGCLYAGMGVWIGWRLVALGVALTALTLIGFYAVDTWYALYMGVVSGGALVLGGLWLRRV